MRTFHTILKEEGWRAFYAGLGTNMMRAVPAATVTMLTYEYVMQRLRQTRDRGRHKLGLPAFSREQQAGRDMDAAATLRDERRDMGPRAAINPRTSPS